MLLYEPEFKKKKKKKKKDGGVMEGTLEFERCRHIRISGSPMSDSICSFALT